MKPAPIGITRILALAGATDFSFVDEEAKFRGSEVHRMCELSALGRLQRKSVPIAYRGYLQAHEKFMVETKFIPAAVEHKVECKTLGVRGRIDCSGYMRGRPALVEWKSGAIQPAVALQLCLGGHLLKEGEWWERIAVQLKPDGTYSAKIWSIKDWHADLSTALACCRVARWKIQNGMV